MACISRHGPHNGITGARFAAACRPTRRGPSPRTYRRILRAGADAHRPAVRRGADNFHWLRRRRPGDSVGAFTSEAGSSCPPTVANVGEFAQHPNVLALTFRLDYWDDLGWSGRLGWPESLKRQRTYTRSRRLCGTSPPASDKRQSLIGNDRASIGRDLATRSGASVKLPIRGGDWRPPDWSRRNIASPITAFSIVQLVRTMNKCTGENKYWGAARYWTKPRTRRFRVGIKHHSLEPRLYREIPGILRVLPTVALHALNKTMVAQHAHRHRRPMVLKADCIR